MCIPYKGPTEEIINRGPPVCMHRQEYHIGTLRILWSMSVCGGLWKHQNNPACTKLGVRAIIRLKLDTIKKKKKKN